MPVGAGWHTNQLGEASLAVMPQAAIASGRRHVEFRSPSTTMIAAAHSATDHQPVKATRSVPVGGGDGASPVGAIGGRRPFHCTAATADEARAALPGDDIMQSPTTIWNRGITIEASPSAIWPWLVQMGYGRAGFYVPEWIDRLVWRVPAANSSVLEPEFQHIAVDDIVADGPDFMAYWRVRIVDPERALVYWTRRHPWRGAPVDPTDANALAKRERELVAGGTYAECSWGFYLREIGAGRTRLVIRTRAVSSPAWLRRMPYGLFDAYLSHAELSGIKRQVEQTGETKGRPAASRLGLNRRKYR